MYVNNKKTNWIIKLAKNEENGPVMPIGVPVHKDELPKYGITLDTFTTLPEFIAAGDEHDSSYRQMYDYYQKRYDEKLTPEQIDEYQATQRWSSYPEDDKKFLLNAYKYKYMAFMEADDRYGMMSCGVTIYSNDGIMWTFLDDTYCM